MAWSLLPCHTTGCFSLCFFGASFFLSSLDGKREFTATGALSTSTTVRLLTASSARAIQSADRQVCVCCRCLTSGGLMSVCALFVCVQTRRTRSGRTLACRVQPSQDPWVVSAARSSGSHAPGGLSAASSSVPVRHGRTALSPPLNMPTPLCCCMYGRTTSEVALRPHTATLHSAVLFLTLSSLQAVPYSREFKQKYDYFRKKLKKPVRNDLGCWHSLLGKQRRTWSKCHGVCPLAGSRLIYIDEAWLFSFSSFFTARACVWYFVC